jgi:DNA-binding HxlR family transcriptional regulator
MPPPVRQPIDPLVINAVLTAVRQAANVLCDRWTLLLLLAAHGGTTRFADFRERCGCASRLLTARLTLLEEQEVLVRMAYSRRPLRHGYHLTPMGLALFDTFAALLAWEQRWHPSSGGSSGGSAGGPGLALDHGACGTRGVRPKTVCASCGEAVTARDVSLHIHHKEMRERPDRAAAYRRARAGAAADASALASPLPHALAIFGDQWSIEVLMCAFVQVDSFSGFLANTGMSTNILADRLSRLVEAGVLRREPGTDGAARGRYRLTEPGVDLFNVLVCIEAWADHWLRDRTRSPMRLVHTGCGHALRLAVRCGECHQALTRADCHVRTGELAA